MKIINKIPGLEIDGEGIYAVYKTNLTDIGEGDVEIKRSVVDVGLKDKMIAEYPNAIDLEKVAEVLELK